MALFKCKMCGGTLEINDETVAICEYCGTKQTVPNSQNEIVSNLFNRANNLRLKCEFDKAEDIYEKILQADETQAEAYWGLILCKYGIEYVEDPKTFARIPTCHRTSFDSIIADEDYKSALKYADGIQRGIYENEAKEIDRIQKDILALSQKEEPYDVFICYKETDSLGKRTQDSVIANDIYYQLTTEGFKVFYAAITLEDKLGSAYEPCIFAALNSAKVMLSIGTKPEYFNAVWVKNEWARFLKMMKKDRSKMLIPCYKDMDAYELPEEFAHLQAQDMSKIGFVNDIVRGIKKIVQTDEPKATVVKETVVASEGLVGNVTALLKRGFMALEDCEWTKADDFFEQSLNHNAELAEAYLGKLMAELRVKTQDELKDCAEPFDDRNNYQKVMRFADDNLKTTLARYLEYINTRNDSVRLENIYSLGKTAMSKAVTEAEFKEAAGWFESIVDYKDCSALAKECYDKAEVARKDLVLREAKSWLEDSVVKEANSWMTDAIISCEKAIGIFKSISGWKDADEQNIVCQRKIEEIKAKKEAERIERERQAELEKIEAEKRAKKNKKIAIIATPIVCAIIAFLIIFNSVIIPNGKYNDAIALMDAGKVMEAYESLVALDGHKDSAEKARSIYNQYKIEKLKTVKEGDYVKFGSYEQDNNLSNGNEEIEWMVLSKNDQQVLLISKYILNYQKFNESENYALTWSDSLIRSWLNDDFKTDAFTNNEESLIYDTTIIDASITKDKIFLLSDEDVKKYFKNTTDRVCENTPYSNSVMRGDESSWWLRTKDNNNSTKDSSFVIIVHSNGTIGSRYSSDYMSLSSFSYCGVRPAMWIDLSKT